MREVFNNETIKEGKLIAIISYILLIGLIIALILNNDKRNSYASFHIRQSIGLALLGIMWGVISFIPIIGWLIGLVITILWIMGFLQAIFGKTDPLPIVGNYFQQLFSTL